MKRDLDLIRNILKDIESTAADQYHPIRQFEYDGHEAKEINEHVFLLKQSGFITGAVEPIGDPDGYAIAIFGLSWKGHDFISTAKDDTLWKAAKEKVLKQTGGIACEILFEWLKVEAKKKLSLP